ncbi:uncharacterized protein METZ01_LOCUS223449 [marine metagenome]|uniref:Uncharacterized protein n=1 Tax=marine metagenome TaxID=408172 RepID=A0A382G729_9ZZZZ
MLRKRFGDGHAVGEIVTHGVFTAHFFLRETKGFIQRRSGNDDDAIGIAEEIVLALNVHTVEGDRFADGSDIDAALAVSWSAADGEDGKLHFLDRP